MNIYDMFKDDPYIKSSHKKDIDHLKMVVEYMLNHEDDDGKDMQQLLQHGSPKIFIGSEGIQRFLNFDMPGFGILKQYFIDCEDDVRQIANDSRLNRNPMMKPYLNYSKMIMGRGLMEHPDRNSYASDVVYNSVSAIAGMFTRIPTEAELEHIRQTNPQVYETGLKIMKYIDAFTEFNDPKLLLQYDQTDKIDRQALQQERMRRLDNLEQAAHEFAGISRNQLMYFYDIIGCDVPDYTKNSVSADLYDNKKHNTEAGIRQLQDYRRLMQQGLTLEEAASVIAAPFWSTIGRERDEQLRRQYAYLRTVFPSLLVTGPFSVVLGFTGGLMALNDRLKLRSMVVGEKEDKVFIASEEAAIRTMEPDAENVWAPAGGEPVIIRVKEGAY